MASERTLSIIKPDATERNITGLIVARLEAAGLRVIAQKRVWWKKKDAKKFYEVHKDQPFYKDLITFMTSGPIVLQVLEGDNAIAKNREVMGATNPGGCGARLDPQGFRRQHAAEFGARLRRPRDRQARNRPLLQEGGDRRVGASPYGLTARRFPAHLLSVCCPGEAAGGSRCPKPPCAYRVSLWPRLSAWQRQGFGLSPHPVRRRPPPRLRRRSRLQSELRAAKALDAVRGDPLALYVFLKRMPKGADLHNHLDGAVYAETFIRVGGEDGLCVDPVAKAFTKSQPIKSGAEPEPVCEAGDVHSRRRAEEPASLRRAGGLVLDARLRPVEGETRARPFLRDVRQVRRHRSAPHRRVSRTRSRPAPPRRTSNISS